MNAHKSCLLCSLDSLEQQAILGPLPDGANLALEPPGHVVLGVPSVHCSGAEAEGGEVM